MKLLEEEKRAEMFVSVAVFVCLSLCDGWERLGKRNGEGQRAMR